MNKVKLNYVIDMVMLLVFLICAITGILLLVGVRGITIKDIHNLSGIILLALVIIHFVLHWKWIVCITKQCLK